MPNEKHWRTLLPRLAALVAVVTLVAAGCGDDGGGSADPADPADNGSGDTPAETRQIEHALGVTEVPADPQRIVALGPSELDAALALGAPVVGTASNGTDAQISPWTAELDGADDLTFFAVTGDALTVDLEEVAALDPDLIIASTYYDIDASYDLMSQIAPTIAYQSGPVSDSWRDVTRQVGAALGLEDDAEALIAEVEASLADAAEANPQLDGATYTFGYVLVDSVSALRDPDDVMMEVPSALGMTMSPEVLALPESDNFATSVSYEQIDALDADVLALFTGGDAEAEAAIESNPLYTNLDVVQRDAVVRYDYDEFMAMRQPTVAAIPWLVDGVVPRLADAAATTTS